MNRRVYTIRLYNTIYGIDSVITPHVSLYIIYYTKLYDAVFYGFLYRLMFAKRQGRSRDTQKINFVNE